LALGQALCEEGRVPDAFASARRALAVTPDDAAALCLLGSIAGRQGRAMAALLCYRAAARLVPSAAEPRVGMGQALEELRQAGAAIGCYRLAVRLQPRDAATRITLANALRRQGMGTEAAVAYREAIALGADNVSVWANLGVVLQGLGRLSEAESAYLEALRRRPDHAETHNNLGLLRHAVGHHAKARDSFHAALTLDPCHGPALVNLGLADAALGDHGRAELWQRRAIAHDPGRAEAWNNLATACKAQGRREDAEACLKRALALKPAFADALGNLGSGLSDREAFGPAVMQIRRAIRLMPNHAPLHAVLAYALNGARRPQEAGAACRKALVLVPSLADPLCTLGLAEQRQGRTDAGRWFERAVAAAPGHALARFNRGLLSLERGALRAGWADYAYRFKAGRVRPERRFTIPEWTGEPLEGKRLFIWREQGVGDEFLFASCYPDLIRMAGRVVIECDRRLVPLFARSFPKATVRAEQPPCGQTEAEVVDCDYHIPAGSVPRLLRERLSAFPTRSCWLFADGSRIADWRERLDGAGDDLRVGISWRSQLMTADRCGAYLPLDAWGPVFAVPGVTFVNLQYDECQREILAAERQFGQPIYGWTGVDLRDDFEQTAALVSALDLVIAPANSVAELAGALGVPVWRFGHRDWTQLGTAGRPWYPSMRLFQPLAGQGLEQALQRIAVDLRRVAAV
ncbi:tetratricopeptide repeat protein, partial [Azospirillum sp. B506]|uniref:tetratricopeptide repeat protein n=1 Tax=Azospirillum sp. B506 TaxID=137721 RepID=UPI0009FFC210